MDNRGKRLPPRKGRVEVIAGLLATLDGIDKKVDAVDAIDQKADAEGEASNETNQLCPSDDAALGRMAEIRALQVVVNALDELRRGERRPSAVLQKLHDRLLDQYSRSIDQDVRGQRRGAPALSQSARNIRLVALGCVDCLAKLPGFSKGMARNLVVQALTEAGIRRHGGTAVTVEALRKEWGEGWFKREAQIESSANPHRGNVVEARAIGEDALKLRIECGEDIKAAMVEMFHQIPK